MMPVDAFRPFTLTHGVTLLSVAALIALIVLIGRRQRAASPTLFERTLAYANLAVWFTAHGYWQMPERFDPVTTLPLQMCHLTSLVASAVFLTRHHALRAVLFFWAFALCTQALITPSLVEPTHSPIFWAFWFLHGFVMMAAVYDLAVNGFRSYWREYGIACAAAAIYVAVVLPIDVLLRANYGFLGRSTALHPSIVDLLGPWPQRLLIIVPLAALAMLVMLLPWLAARKFVLSPPRQ
ncbi:MAG: TIGR02206 family membrane protein [Betaproteobacteria bacterium]|nr:TIGR02206 family membrane protein [Betaproteobacteria bacterium]